MTPEKRVNGVNVDQLFKTIDMIKQKPEITSFKFRATNRWIEGTHSRATVKDFYGPLQEDTFREPTVFELHEPPILLGNNQGIVIKDFFKGWSAPGSSAFSNLTAREREVLRLMAEGKTTNQIDYLLCLSAKTTDGCGVWSDQRFRTTGSANGRGLRPRPPPVGARADSG